MISVAVSGDSSASSKNSKMRSAAAMVDWSMLARLANWTMGLLKWRMYWIKDWMEPTKNFPWMTHTAPSMVTMIYPRLPMKLVTGMMMPEMKLAFQL